MHHPVLPQSEDPKDYRWCGYAAAVAGVSEARGAVRWLVALNPHGGMREEVLRVVEALRRWRCLLFGIPENEARQAEEEAKEEYAEVYRSRIPREKALEVLAQGGRLPQSVYLRCKVRYFTDGAVLGGRGFVEEIFQAFRERFSAKRRSGARALRGVIPAGREELFNLRQLQTRVFG